MAVKPCIKCGVDKDVSLFPRRLKRSDGLASMCKPCESVYQRAWIAAHRDKVNARVKSRRLRVKNLLIEFLGGKCHDCEGVFPPAVYDFHHLDPTIKEKNFASGIPNWSLERMKKEAAKCILLCSNCHRIRHIE